MSYNTNYAAQRFALTRIAKALGVPTQERAGKRTMPRPNNVLRVAAFETLYGLSWGELAEQDAASFDKALAHALDTAQGKHGVALQLAQAHIKRGKDAMHAANVSAIHAGRVTPSAVEKLKEARDHFALARAYQDKHMECRRQH